MVFAPSLAHVDLCFFFQAEDGIRDLIVTGVQTCALPILFIVLSLAGGGGFYAYKKGWLLATPGPATGARDSTARDTSAAADSAGRADTSGALASATGGGTGHDTSRSHQPPPSPGTPARLTLQGVPQGARLTLNGQPVRGPQVDVPPGVYKLAVRAA